MKTSKFREINSIEQIWLPNYIFNNNNTEAKRQKNMAFATILGNVFQFAVCMVINIQEFR